MLDRGSIRTHLLSLLQLVVIMPLYCFEFKGVYGLLSERTVPQP